MPCRGRSALHLPMRSVHSSGGKSLVRTSLLSTRQGSVYGVGLVPVPLLWERPVQPTPAALLASSYALRTRCPPFPGADTDLRRWGLQRAAGGKSAKKRAVVAVARKLAVLLHRLWVTGEVYEPLRQQEVLAS
jgi:hypothetical protein